MESILYNKQTKEYETDLNEININLKLNTVEQIILFKQFLEAERIIEQFKTCGGFCTASNTNTNKLYSDCGCSKT